MSHFLEWGAGSGQGGVGVGGGRVGRVGWGGGSVLTRGHIFWCRTSWGGGWADGGGGCGGSGAVGGRGLMGVEVVWV